MKPLTEIYKKPFFSGRRRRRSQADVLARAVADTYPFIQNVIDVGCATGHLVSAFRDIGIAACGIEGSEHARPYTAPDILVAVEYRDLRRTYSPPRRYDAVTCIEVMEHVEQPYAKNFARNLCTLSDLLILTIAGPGQEGTGHVNLQPMRYWNELFGVFGYQYQLVETNQFRGALKPHIETTKDIAAYIQNAAIYRKEGV